MDKLVLFFLALLVFLAILVIGGCIADYVLPRCKRIDSYLGDIARQKKG